MLSDLLEQVTHRRAIKGDLRTECVNGDSPIDNGLYVSGSVRKRDRDLLRRITTCLPHVIPTHADRIELRKCGYAVLDDIDNEPHGWLRRINVSLPGQVLL